MPPHLPNEVFHHIFTYLVPTLPRSPRRIGAREKYDPSLRPIDLATLCLVNHRLFSIAQPLLYHTIIMTYQTIFKTWAVVETWPILFMRTITEKPQLAKNIRVLALFDGLALSDAAPAEWQWDIPRIMRHAVEPGLQYVPRHLPTVLLFYATMVEKVVIHAEDPEQLFFHWMLADWRPVDNLPFGSIDFGTDFALEYGPFANYGFYCLKELRIEACEDERFDLHPHTAMFYKQGLSTLSLSHIRWTSDVFVARSIQEPPSSLRSLELKDCYIDAPSIEGALRTCPGLQSLILHTIRTNDTELWNLRQDTAYTWIIDLPRIGQALRTYGGNLINLQLNFSNYKVIESPVGRVGSLCALEKLRYLGCYRDDLMDSQEVSVAGSQEQAPATLESFLPSSLALLSIKYGDYKYSDQRLEIPCPDGDEIRKDIEGLLRSERLKSFQGVSIQRFVGYSTTPTAIFENGPPGWLVRSQVQKIQTQCYAGPSHVQFTGITKLRQ